ncbi:MAG: glycoside hydrolase family 2 sugar binding protein, partial [Bacilli bacterium]|nr:glycoside hydrolase family 2 sugar binding protein [Bacilli bacterium]
MSEMSGTKINEGLPISKTINRDWKFSYFPASTEDFTPIGADFDDQAWPAVAIPHTWSTFETTGELHPFIRNPSEKDSDFWWYGWGWYRKRFTIEDCYQSQKIFLEFDGVQKYSKIWLNGQYIGEHKGGFTSFYFNVTHAVRFNEENVLSVEVSNRRNDNFGGIPPMTAGNWNLYGGIYRDVRLVIKDRLHIPFQGSADHEGGTFITTPELTAERGKVSVRTFVKNEYDHTVPCTLRTTIVDAENRIVASIEETKSIASGALSEFDQTSAEIDRPNLWSPDSPYLYKVISQVEMNEQITDEYESPLGFRWFEW